MEDDPTRWALRPGTADELVAHGQGVHPEIRSREVKPGVWGYRFLVVWTMPNGYKHCITSRHEYATIATADRAAYRYIRRVCGPDAIRTAANAPSCDDAEREMWERYPGLFKGHPPQPRQRRAA